MKENLQHSFDEVFAALNDDQRQACFIFCVTKWQSGVNADYVIAMDVSIEIVKRLVAAGLIEEETHHEFIEEWLEQHKDQYETIQAARKASISFELSNEQRTLIKDYERQKDMLLRQQKTPKYRLFSQEFADFTKKKMK